MILGALASLSEKPPPLRKNHPVNDFSVGGGSRSPPTIRIAHYHMLMYQYLLNVDWLSQRKTVSGYEIQTLYAQANAKSSNLKLAGSRSLSTSKSWKVGALQALGVVGTAAAGNIPIVSVTMTVYDTAKAFIAGITPETEISAAEVVYSYSHLTTASFKYVKPVGQPDNQQSLSYISTMGVTSVAWQYPTFSQANGSMYPQMIQGKRDGIVSKPSGYDSNINAVAAYRDSSATSRDYNESVKITGLESKIVSSIYPVCPEFPAHIY